MKKYYFLLLLCLAFANGFTQPKKVTFQQLDSLQTLSARPIVVFLHTDWCKFCRLMHAKTFANQQVIELLNQKFYFIDFNAEQQEKVVFNNQTFVYKPNGTSTGIHDLAIALGTVDKQVNFPTLCVLNAKNEIIFKYNSFISATDLVKILKSLH